MSKIVVLFLAILLLACQEQDKNVKVTYFEKGTKNDISSEKINLNKLTQRLKALFAGTDDMLKLHVDSSIISGIINRDSGIEIIFLNEQSFQSKEFGIIKLRKILIPFSGEYVGSEQSPIITLFPGNETFYSGPFRNSTGFSYLMEIKESIMNIKQ